MDMPNSAATAVMWIDARVGVAGDMLMAALVAAGADAEAVAAAVATATGGLATVAFEPAVRAGISATSARVATSQAHQPHRGLADIVAILTASGLAPDVVADATAVFERLARVEAAIHGCDVSEVHFHELGALDTIADVVGVLTAWRSLGRPEATCSEVAVGSGTVRIAHGEMSVPAPAVAALLAEAGAPSLAGPLPREATTPTGAALVAHLCDDRWGPQPAMRTTAQGFGAGGSDVSGVPNVTRVVVGSVNRGDSDAPAALGRSPADAATGAARLVELQCNIDDLDPRLWPEVLDQLLAAGALDAWHAPITMKHGRPGQMLAVLCEPDRADAMTALIFANTTTFGVRRHEVSRVALERHWVPVDVDGQTVRVKIGGLDGTQITAQPEWRDVVAAADALGMPAREVLRRAREAL